MKYAWAEGGCAWVEGVSARIEFRAWARVWVGAWGLMVGSGLAAAPAVAQARSGEGMGASVGRRGRIGVGRVVGSSVGFGVGTRVGGGGGAGVGNDGSCRSEHRGRGSSTTMWTSMGRRWQRLRRKGRRRCRPPHWRGAWQRDRGESRVQSGNGRRLERRHGSGVQSGPKRPLQRRHRRQFQRRHGSWLGRRKGRRLQCRHRSRLQRRGGRREQRRDRRWLGLSLFFFSRYRGC